MVRAGGGRSQGRLAGGSELHRLRARERNRLPHLHGPGARPVRHHVQLVPARPDTEAGAGGAARLPQGRVPGCLSRGSGRGRSGRGPSTGAAATTRTGKRYERQLAPAPPGRLAISRRPASSRCCSHWPHRVGADPPAHGRDGRLAGQRPWRTRLVRRHLGPDDGGDDAPAVAPMVAAYRGRTAGLGATPAFAAGYLIAWLVAGLLGYVLVEGVRSLALGFLAWDEAGRYLAGSVILGGELYQLTRPKDACLRRCRDARGFLGDHWRPGRAGALRMGAERGGLLGARLAPGRGEHGFDADALSQGDSWMTSSIAAATTVSGPC